MDTTSVLIESARGYTVQDPTQGSMPATRGQWSCGVHWDGMYWIIDTFVMVEQGPCQVIQHQGDYGFCAAGCKDDDVIERLLSVVWIQ